MGDKRNLGYYLRSSGGVAALWVLALIAVILIAPTLTQAISIDAPKTFSDLATLLFGTASIALFILSLVVSVLAIVGWGQIKQNIRDAVQKDSADAYQALKEETAAQHKKLRDDTAESNRKHDVDTAETNQELREEIEKVASDLRAEMSDLRSNIDRLGTEMRGRNLAVFGYMLGKLSLDQDRQEVQPGKEELLRDAVETCDSAFELVKDSGGAVEFLALNNLVFFASIQAAANPEVLPGRSFRSRTWLLAKARVLVEKAREHQRDGSPNTIPLLLTFCCAAVLFSDRESDAREALVLVNELLNRDDASKAQKSEAQHYLESLRRKIDSFNRNAG